MKESNFDVKYVYVPMFVVYGSFGTHFPCSRRINIPKFPNGKTYCFELAILC